MKTLIAIMSLGTTTYTAPVSTDDTIKAEVTMYTSQQLYDIWNYNRTKHIDSPNIVML